MVALGFHVVLAQISAPSNRRRLVRHLFLFIASRYRYTSTLSSHGNCVRRKTLCVSACCCVCDACTAASPQTTSACSPTTYTIADVYSCFSQSVSQSINHLFAQDKIKMAITHTRVASEQDNKAISALIVVLKTYIHIHLHIHTFIHNKLKS